MVDDRATVRLPGAPARTLALGESLSFGRAPTCDLAVGAAGDGRVEDTGVSRLAGTVRLDRSGATIANASTSRALTVRPSVGPERIVGTGEALTVGAGRYALVLHGQVFVHTIELDVELGATDQAPIAPAGTPTTLIALRERERRYCAALCEPLLDRRAERAEPATYRQAGERLGVAPASVRKVVDEVRQRLLGQGFHGLDGDGGRDALVRLLVESGTVTTHDLERLA